MGTTTIDALENLLIGFIDFIPKLVGAFIVFIIGWIIAVAIGKLIAEILKRIKFNQIFEKGGWKTALEKADIKVDASSFIGAIFKWVLLIAFLIAAVQILGLGQLRDFFIDVLNYLPNVIVAAFILVVAIIIADILEKVVRAMVDGTRIGYGQIVGVIVNCSMWIFAIFAFLLHGKILFGFYAAIGALGLAGVVINDSIIMLVKLDKEYDNNRSKEESTRQIARLAQTRLRAVILTTLTTAVGVLPTAYGFAGYDAMLAEMMLSLAWGLIFGTAITLLLIPCLYGLEKDLRFKFFKAT